MISQKSKSHYDIIDEKCAEWLKKLPDFENVPKVNIQVWKSRASKTGLKNDSSIEVSSKKSAFYSKRSLAKLDGPKGRKWTVLFDPCEPSTLW